MRFVRWFILPRSRPRPWDQCTENDLAFIREMIERLEAEDERRK